ncbi:hypothetical protein [Nostoc sp. TCL240-02]
MNQQVLTVTKNFTITTVKIHNAQEQIKSPHPAELSIVHAII